MSRNLRWKQSPTDIYPLCQAKIEITKHVYQYQDPRARTNRSIHILAPKNALKALNTAPFIINHLSRAIYQFSSNFPVPLVQMNQTSADERKQEATNVNHQLKMGMLPLLSGYLCREVSSTQQLHMNNVKLHRKPNIHSWSRGVIRALLDYSQSVWKFCSDILHNESTFTQETMLREQAVKLLFSLLSTQLRLPQKSRNLLLRTKECIQTTHLRNIISLAVFWGNYITRSM